MKEKNKKFGLSKMTKRDYGKVFWLSWLLGSWF